MGNEVKKNLQNHAPLLKANITLKAAREERTIMELSVPCTVIQIRAKKCQLLDGAVDLFESGLIRSADRTGVHAKIGELTVERDCCPASSGLEPARTASPNPRKSRSVYRSSVQFVEHSRSTLYCQPVPVVTETLEIVRAIDEIHTVRLI